MSAPSLLRLSGTSLIGRKSITAWRPSANNFSQPKIKSAILPRLDFFQAFTTMCPCASMTNPARQDARWRKNDSR
jgi:hypothetical protein